MTELSDRMIKEFVEYGPVSRTEDGLMEVRFWGTPEQFHAAARRLLASERLNRDQLENEALDESTAYRKRSGLKEQVSAIAAVSYEDGWLDAYEVAQDRIFGPAPEAEPAVCGTCGGEEIIRYRPDGEPCSFDRQCPSCAPSDSPPVPCGPGCHGYRDDCDECEAPDKRFGTGKACADESDGEGE